MGDGIPPQGWPGGGGYSRPIRPVPGITKKDCSFIAYPVELKFDSFKKEEDDSSLVSSQLSCQEGSDGSSGTELADVSNNLFENEDLQLTDLYFDNKGKEKEEELNKKIGKYRCFYLVNDKYWTISLKNKDLYKRYKDDGEFIGNKFKEILPNDDEMALMVQVVNERYELKSIGKFLFYREIYLHTYKNSSIKKLFKTYIGNNEEQFLFDERENVRFYRWKFNVHKNRLVYVFGLLKTNFNVKSDCLKTVKSYDDVLKYFLNHK